MGDIISSLLVAIITSIFTALCTLYIQKRKNENIMRKNALYLYLNLKQIKMDIDKDKKEVDRAGENEIFPMCYFSPFDYVGILCEIKDKLSEQEIMTINNFYENVKSLDNNKMYYFNMRNLHSNNPSMNPMMPGMYEQQYRDSYNKFVHSLNTITNSDEYKKDIVEIVLKLRKLKDK